jgi:uncharacterized protein
MNLLPEAQLSANKQNAAYPAYVVILWSLSLLFFLRVIGQLIQQTNSVAWLPQLGAWQGSSLPYGFLLLSQLIILAVMLRIAQQHSRACVQKNPKKGKWLMLLGGAYFAGMAARLVIGVADLSLHPWFQKFIPAFFHLVLATFVLLLAAFHLNLIDKNNRRGHSEEI